MSRTISDQHTAQTVVIALGANMPSTVGPPAQSIVHAMEQIGAQIGRITGKSRLFSTPCFPEGAGPDYVNAALALRSDTSPEEILVTLHAIEAAFNRSREVRWGQRTLDLDLVCCGDLVLPDVAEYSRWRHLPAQDQSKIAPNTLILPHPRLQDRAFVLVPMLEVVPDWVHPVLGRSTQQMHDDLPATDRAGVTPLPQPGVS